MFLSLLEAAVPAITRTQIDLLLDRLLEFGISAGKHILIAAIVYAIGRAIIGIINRVVARLLNRQHIDPSVQTFLRSMIKILLTILLIISVIGALGINTTSFAALLASAGVAVGMALSGNLQNFAGGLVILLFKPYKVGDWIEAQGVQGSVKEIQIFHTVLVQADNKVVYVPNGSMSTAVVVNYSRLDTRRVEWTIGIDYGEDVDKARAAILEALGREPLILADPEPTVALGALADSSVNLTVRVWTKTGDYWPVFNNGYRLIYDAFNAKGINFPYPNQTVHIVRE
ncbi:MAG: mechanosensitive ion channel [Alloprevotella sp.]|nr:mechanosensitive ion channel [Bacteroidales bacterium]MCI6105192.1 mechanosensitive ion channel [Bacteroidales bacterium]MDY2605887.1 mechanosensitive ion channel [Alloprevotella sp.]MDY6033000.1 mechanosensitive ion channel [Alloprevotella sp.]